jgi:hypothetical protein
MSHPQARRHRLLASENCLLRQNIGEFSFLRTLVNSVGGIATPLTGLVKSAMLYIPPRGMDES